MDLGGLKIFSNDYFIELSRQARSSDRLRQHRNVHHSYQDPCQRLFNAIEPGSYIRPHRHAVDIKNELLVAVRGLIALVAFDDLGTVVDVVRFGSTGYGAHFAAGAEVAASTWHTVIALRSESILLEVKAGPFDPSRAKDLAPWAPEEGSSAASDYLEKLAALATD